MRDLRWKPPQPVEKWTGVRRADRFGYQCMQMRVFDDMVFRNAGVSEDCLYLNVWTPSPSTSAAGAGLPVLVYFYGGGFVGGDGSEYRYDGESLARHGIVVVTMSYRLGIFGFMAHPELTAESPDHASGDDADQVLALYPDSTPEITRAAASAPPAIPPQPGRATYPASLPSAVRAMVMSRALPPSKVTW